MFIHRRLLATEGEEPTATTPQPQPVAPGAIDGTEVDPSQAPEDPLNSPWKAPMAAEIVRLRKEKKEILDKQKAAAEEAERKSLEEQGKWKEIADQEKAKREQLEKSHAAEARRWELEKRLVGLPKLAISGAIAECPPDANIDEYTAKVLEDNKALLVGTGEPQRTIAQGGRGSVAGGNWANDRALIERVENGEVVNPKELDAAYSRVLKYQSEHDGKRPW
jgi:hypothetical protein